MKLNTLNSIKMIRGLALAALMTFTGALANAESLPIRVSIPFAFTANGVVMPAGDYSVKPIEGLARAVVLHSITSGKNLIALAFPASDSAKMSLTFASADSGKALSSISAPGWGVKFNVPAPLKVAVRTEVPGVVVLASVR